MKRRIFQPLTSLKAMAVFWIFGYFIAIPVWQTFQPSSHWLDVHSIKVADAVVGQDPMMTVQRTLNLSKATRGIWVAKVTNQNGILMCSNSGVALYEPRAKLPESRNFKLFHWWLNAGKNGPEDICTQWPLPTGKYCVQTLWEFFPENYPASKHVIAPEACFEYTEP